MRVFISWSKEPSRSIAAALGSWLGGLVQAVDPWVSDEEIASGKRWRDEIATVLNDTDFGIICLTRANQHNPWLMFEAGALAKHLAAARVIPLYIDLDAAEVTGPLADWQGRRLDREGMARVVHDINAATPKPVAKDSLQRLFDRMWEDFESEVATAKEKAPEAQRPPRSQQAMLEEVVERLRLMDRDRVRGRRWRLSPGDLITLAGGFSLTVPDDPPSIAAMEQLLTRQDDQVLLWAPHHGASRTTGDEEVGRRTPDAGSTDDGETAEPGGPEEQTEA